MAAGAASAFPNRSITVLGDGISALTIRSGVSAVTAMLGRCEWYYFKMCVDSTPCGYLAALRGQLPPLRGASKSNGSRLHD